MPSYDCRERELPGFIAPGCKALQQLTVGKACRSLTLQQRGQPGWRAAARQTPHLAGPFDLWLWLATYLCTLAVKSIP
jgi:hypothetical protein